MSLPFLYVANWKMDFTHEQAISFCAQHVQDLQKMKSAQSEIVLCPSFTELDAVSNQIKNTSIQLGAQNCSRHRAGAFTGEISAQTLKKLGCSYCIVGHSERRQYHHESNIEIAAKVERLIEVGITPIICIGETAQEYENKQTKVILEQQLDLVFDVLNNFNNDAPIIPIAYEPVWSIGTGTIASQEYLAEIFQWLFKTVPTFTKGIEYRYLYGGSVNEKNASEIKQIPHISGFLIGSASRDFQKFKNIVS